MKLFFQTNIDQSYIYNNGFLSAFNEIAANVNNPAAVSSSNIIANIFGGASNAITSIGKSTFTSGAWSARPPIRLISATTPNCRGLVSRSITCATSRNFKTCCSATTTDGPNTIPCRFACKGSSSTVRVAANFTWSKSLDNDLSAATGGEGNGFAAPLDSYNEGIDRGRSNFDIPKAFTMTSQYTLPIGKGHMFGGDMPKWANSLFGGWDLGSLWIYESGTPFTVSSGFATGPSTTNTWADYTGSRNIGGIQTNNNGIGPGVYYFTPAQVANFSEPAAGTFGTAGRNTFRGPRFFNVDASLVKRFELMERKYLTFRAEAYNLVNHPDFNNPAVNIGGVISAFGKISSTVNNPRILQMALRFDF